MNTVIFAASTAISEPDRCYSNDVGDFDPNPSASMTTIFVGDRANARLFHKAKLVITRGPDKGRTFDIAKGSVTGGRGTINDMVIEDRSVSTHHFRIENTEDGYRLKDVGSRNGIYVAGVRVMDAILTPGAEFQLGRTVIRFEPSDETVEIKLHESDKFGNAIGTSVAMREVFAHLQRLAKTDITCLISGETGTGKEEMAQAIHQNSNRANQPFIVIDCGAIPRELMESTLFGHEKGAFTGASDRHIGLFEAADKGTVFLDELGELDISMQPKLLRVLESRSVQRVGADAPNPIDVRVIAATNRDLRSEVAKGAFREDLYFRIAGAQIQLPPLRQRRDDIAILAQTFLDKVAARKEQELALGQDAIEAMRSYPWPGNVRELRNVVERAAILCEGETISRSDLQFGDDRITPGDAYELMSVGENAATAARGQSINIDEPFKEAKQRIVDSFEVAYLAKLLEMNSENISKSARQAGLTRYHLRELLKRHGIAPKR